MQSEFTNMVNKIPSKNIFLGILLAAIAIIISYWEIKTFIEIIKVTAFWERIIQWFVLNFLPLILGGIIFSLIIFKRVAWKEIWWFILLFGLLNFSFLYLTRIFFNFFPNKHEWSGGQYFLNEFLGFFVLGYLLGLGEGTVVKKRRLLCGVVSGIAFLSWLYFTHEISVKTIRFASQENFVADFYGIYRPFLIKLFGIEVGTVSGIFLWWPFKKEKFKE